MEFGREGCGVILGCLDGSCWWLQWPPVQYWCRRLTANTIIKRTAIPRVRSDPVNNAAMGRMLMCELPSGK